MRESVLERAAFRLTQPAVHLTMRMMLAMTDMCRLQVDEEVDDAHVGGRVYDHDE